MRVTAQLLDSKTGAQLWNEAFKGDLSNLFSLQDQVTTLVGNSIGERMVITRREVRHGVGRKVFEDRGQPCADRGGAGHHVIEELAGEQELSVAVGDHGNEAQRRCANLGHRLRPRHEPAEDDSVDESQVSDQSLQRLPVLTIAQDPQADLWPDGRQDGHRPDRHLHAVALGQ